MHRQRSTYNTVYMYCILHTARHVLCVQTWHNSRSATNALFPPAWLNQKNTLPQREDGLERFEVLLDGRRSTAPPFHQHLRLSEQQRAQKGRQAGGHRHARAERAGPGERHNNSRRGRRTRLVITYGRGYCNNIRVLTYRSQTSTDAVIW